MRPAAGKSTAAPIGPREPQGKSPRLLAAALLACLLGLLGASPASAAPAWLPATELSAPGRNATDSSVAMDEAGETVAVWYRQGEAGSELQASTRSPGGGFSAPAELSLASSETTVAMTPRGEAVAAWVHFENPNDVIQVATRSAGGSFSAPLDVATSEPNSNPQDFQLALSPAGEVALAWKQKEPSSSVDPEQFSVWATVRTAAGGFSEPAIISPQPLVKEDEAKKVRLAIDPGGDVTAVWDYYESGVERDVVQGASRPSGGSFSEPVTLSEAGKNAYEPAVAVDGAGEAIAVWRAEEPPTSFAIQAATRSPGGSFTAPIDLSESGEIAVTPEIAMTPSGAATVVWSAENGTDFAIQASTGSPGGSFSAPTELSAIGENAENPEVAMNAAGATTAVWQRSNGSNEIVQASTGSPGAGFTVPVDLSAAGQDAVFPAVAMDAAGDATALWWRSDGVDEIVEAAGYDADAPELRGLSIPSSGMVGVPVSFSATPFDVWPIASTAFDFGDGASLPDPSVTHTYSAQGTYRVTVTSTDAAGTPVSAEGTIAILPSNRFRIVRLWLSRRKGSATFYIDVPGPGRLVLSGKGIEKVIRRARRAGRVKLPIRARGASLERLKRRGKLKLALSIAFTPDGGTALTKHKKVILIKWLRSARRQRNEPAAKRASLGLPRAAG